MKSNRLTRRRSACGRGPVCHLLDLFEIAQVSPVLAQRFAVVREPGFGVLDDADQVEPEQEVSRRTARAMAQVMHDFLGRVRAFAARTQMHNLSELFAVASDLGVEACPAHTGLSVGTLQRGPASSVCLRDAWDV